MNLFDKMGYMREKNIQVISMSAYKKEDVKAGYELERINPEDIHEAIKLLNGYRITSYNVCYTKLLRFPN